MGYEEPAVTFHESILTATQREVLRKIAPLAKEAGFYLAGGTALALWFGHRLSEDFDWFASTLDRPQELLAETKARGLSLDNVHVEEGTLIGWINGVKVSFYQYRYPMLDPLTSWSDYDVNVASTRDVAAMKLSAIAQRGLRKDFVDVHELLRHGRSLMTMLADYQEKFQSDPFPVLKGLTYFDDAETQPMPPMLNATEWSTVKNEITRAVREVVS